MPRLPTPMSGSDSSGWRTEGSMPQPARSQPSNWFSNGHTCAHCRHRRCHYPSCSYEHLADRHRSRACNTPCSMYEKLYMGSLVNLVYKRIAPLCDQLHLLEVGANWSVIVEESARTKRSSGEFRERLLSAEVTARDQRIRETMLRLATLPSIKTIDRCYFGFANGAPKPQIQQLATLAFTERAANIMLFGLSGVGETHFVIAYALKATQTEIKTRFISAADLMRQLGTA